MTADAKLLADRIALLEGDHVMLDNPFTRAELLEVYKLAQRSLLYVQQSGPLKLDTDTKVFFYEQDHYYLSNFSAFRVSVDGLWFDTSEAAYHWHRFYPEQRAHRRAILGAVSAHEAFRYAQDNKADQRPDWDAIKVDVMRAILRAKAAQHEYVTRKLLQTGDRELIENSWRDDYWGWGPNRDGQNMLGKLWMQVRYELRSDISGKRS